MNYILSNEYRGCIIEFDILSKIYNVNIVFLEKRIKKNNNQGYQIINTNKSNYYILIYISIINNQSIYNLIGVKNKFLFYTKYIHMFLCTIILFSQKNMILNIEYYQYYI